MQEIVSKTLKPLKSKSVQVFLSLFFYFLFASVLPPIIHQVLYTISLLIKDLLMWALPLIVTFFIAHAMCFFRQKAALFIITLVFFEMFSNLASVWYAFLAGHLAGDVLPPIKQLAFFGKEFAPLWKIPLEPPTEWSASNGSIFGMCLGLSGIVFKRHAIEKVIENGKRFSAFCLSEIFARLIPVFVLGFVAKTYQIGFFRDALSHYFLLTLSLVIFLMIYLSWLFLIANRGVASKAFQAGKNLFPAGIVAFTSGSGMATMPWTIEGVCKNVKDKDLAKAVIPATTNIQQVADCIANAFLCFLIYRSFYGADPDFFTWMQFSIVFVLARFATAAILGGAIFIMLPIYQNYLLFTPEMIAIILAFNVLLDPIITCGNVMGNGALCQIFENVWGFILNKDSLIAGNKLKKSFEP